MKKKFVGFLLTLIAITVLSGCGGKTSQSIDPTGYWLLDDETAIEQGITNFDVSIVDDFFHGIMSFSDGLDPVEIYGHYTLDGNTIIVKREDPEGVGKEVTYGIEIVNEKEIIFQYSESGKVHMKRSEPVKLDEEDKGTTSSNSLFSGKEYTEGMYKVGTDIPAGEYCVTNTRGTGTFYVEVSADSSGNSIIANDNLELFGYVSLKDGEYLKINGGSAYAVEGVGNLSDFNNGRAMMGIYKVGKDIPAGEYNIQLLNGATTGYYEVNSSPIGSNSDIITNDNITSNAYVTISDGQYIKLSNCFISLK